MEMEEMSQKDRQPWVGWGTAVGTVRSAPAPCWRPLVDQVEHLSERSSLKAEKAGLFPQKPWAGAVPMHS